MYECVELVIPACTSALKNYKKACTEKKVPLPCPCSSHSQPSYRQAPSFLCVLPDRLGQSAANCSLGCLTLWDASVLVCSHAARGCFPAAAVTLSSRERRREAACPAKPQLSTVCPFKKTRHCVCLNSSQTWVSSLPFDLWEPGLCEEDNKGSSSGWLGASAG